jgi:hypothetical protein
LVREAFAGKDHTGHEFLKKPFVLFPEEERKTVSCQKTEEVLPEPLWFSLQPSLPGTASTENVANNQKSPFLQDPCKFTKCGYPVSENGKDALTEEGVEGAFLEGESFRPSSNDPPRRKLGSSFPEKYLRMVEPHRVVGGGPFQVFQGSTCTTTDVGHTRAGRKSADLKRPFGEVKTSRPYARPRYVIDLPPVERTINRHVTGQLGRLLVFKGLLSLGHLSCRQIFIYQYHAALRASREVDGKDGL